MRNLKRALSLALAAAMLIGMMVIGASAAGLDDFSDKDEIVNQDAVSLLTILGVINGKEDGSYFDPTGNVTRAEMAKMIATILNQGADVDGLYVGIDTGLTDVKGHWAESYINFCYSLNIIAGRGNGKFDPTATVTGNEAAKMLLVAAGYDAEKEGLTGDEWAIRTAALASTLGIFDNLTVPTNDPLSRDNAALLIYNALDIEMIQKYEDGYAIAFEDSRTLLSTKYGVYKVEGVVVANEEAALDGTGSDDAAASGKTKMDHVKVYASTTKNTTNAEYVEEKNPVTFNVSTTADMLGKTVTMYVKKTTVLADSQVLGIYLKDSNNVVKTTADKQDTMKDFLKGSGLTTDANTQYYVNYGFVAGESAGTKALGFDATTGRFTSVNGKTNGSGIELTVIDNDNDGTAEYVLWLQESLTQVIALNESKETATLSGFNSNKAIDNEDIVTDETLVEGDLYLAVSYGGKYYVSVPEVVTGQMTAFSSSKEKQQYIEVGGEKYNPSFILYKADSADNTYEFDILDCGTVDGVDFSIDYDFILDSNGNVIAYRPSEKGLYDFALILDSGYDPGRTSNNPTGEVKVLLPDGTEGTYTLNFSASAQNIGDQLYPTLSSTMRKDNGIETLKSFLGSAVQDTTDTAPDGTLKSGAADHYYNGGINAAGHAKGYVIGYSLNSNNVMTITSIVGSNNTGATHYTPTAATEDPYSIAGVLSSDYNSGAARVVYSTNKELVIDKNTVAFYYTLDANGDPIYGVAVGYEKMSDVKANDASHNSFVASTVKDKDGNPTTLSSSILFNAEGVVAEKDYAYVLSTSNTDKDYVTLNVVLMDGTASTLKIERSDWDTLFAGNPNAFNTVYSYTVKNGIAELTLGTTYKAKIGYAKQLRDGTVALYAKNADGTVGAYISAYSYSSNIWNVEDLSVGDNAPKGAFSQGVYKETILVLDAKEDTVRAAYIKSVYDGAVSGSGHDFTWVLNNYKTLYPDATIANITSAMDAGYNVRLVGNYSLSAPLYLRAGKTLYVTGNLTDAGNIVGGDGTLWVGGTYANTSGSISVNTQVGGNVTMGTTAATISSNLAIETGNLDMNGQNLTVASTSDVYVGGNVVNGGSAATLTVNGHIEANNYNLSGNTVTVLSSSTLIANGSLTAAILNVGNASNAGRVQVAGTVTAAVNATKGSMTADKIVGTVTNSGDCSVVVNNTSATATLGGNATGSFAGNVTLAAGATVASGDTLTVDGTLAVTDLTVTVSGTLNLNGAADISKLAGAQGGKITFGSNFQASGSSSNFVTSTGVTLTADQLAGRSFVYDTQSSKFVTTSVLTENAEMSVALTQPTGNSSYTIAQDAQAVSITITSSVEQVVVTATTDGALAEVTDSSNLVTLSGAPNKTITVNTSSLDRVGDSYTFTLKVSQDGKNSSTYTFTIKVVEG